MATIQTEVVNGVTRYVVISPISDSTYIEICKGTHMNSSNLTSKKEIVNKLVANFYNALNEQGIPEKWKDDNVADIEHINTFVIQYIREVITTLGDKYYELKK